MKKNMTDEFVWLKSDKCCPVCGSSEIGNIEMYFDAGAIYNRFCNRCVCGKCGSEFTFWYWVKDAYITKDGRFDEDNENCTWDGTPCECRTFYGGMGSEMHIYISDGKVLGGEIIDGEWTILDADEAREEYEYLTKGD